MAGREHGEAPHLGQNLSRQRVEQMQCLDHVVEQLDPDRGLGVLRRKDVDHVPAHTKHAALEFDIVAVVLHIRQPCDHVALRHFVVLAQQQNHAVVIGRIANTVNRRHGADDNRIAPLQQRLGCRQPHLLDVFIDARIFFDEHVARRHVGFGLVVVVIRHEILHRVFRKKLAHLRIQLRRERFVRRHDERRAA